MRHHYLICRMCTHPIELGDVPMTHVRCDRCGYINHLYRANSVAITLTFSLTALIFYFPAQYFPFMTIELYGEINSSTIWDGIRSLAENGSWAVALIVFLASLIIPFLKLAILFYLSLTAKNFKNPKMKSQLYRFVEAIGRWSMLDIFLLAILVAIMKLGPWTRVEPEIGSLFFLFVVVFTMLASANFDPRLLWKDGNNESRE